MDYYKLTSYIKEDDEVWDNFKRNFISMPDKMIDFLCDINEVCLKHNLSISHQDGQGSFEIEQYTDSNIRWLINANKNYE